MPDLYEHLTGITLIETPRSDPGYCACPACPANLEPRELYVAVQRKPFCWNCVGTKFKLKYRFVVADRLIRRLHKLDHRPESVAETWDTTEAILREQQWHRSQKITKSTKDYIIARFELSDLTEFKRWILGFGRHAVVLSPKKLVKEIASELAKARAAYSPGFA